jgi:hypothetical protein
VVAPVAVNVVDAALQIVTSGPAFTGVFGVTVMHWFCVKVHPKLSVTEYV